MPATTSPKALIFAPFSPHPSETGAHVHCLMVLEMVRRLGYELIFVSSSRITDAPWSPERISRLARDYGAIVEIHEASVLDPIWCGLQDLQCPDFSDVAWVTPSLAMWFDGLIAKYRPGLVIINYAKWGRLIDCDSMRGIPTMLQTHDLLSVNKAFHNEMAPFFNGFPLDLAQINGEVLEETFFDRVDQGVVPGLVQELSVMRRFDSNIVIAEHEVVRIQSMDPAIRVHAMPMVFAPRKTPNTYALPPVFLAHANNFNFQGLAYFVQKVLPRIRQVEPAFVLRVAGNICKLLKPMDGIELLGFVEDLEGLYGQSRYAICAMLGGTGQQVKVMEAMSFGLPVVVVPRIARATGVVDGVSGLVAPDAATFAEACHRLWRDPGLAHRLGEGARTLMINDHSLDAAFAAFSLEEARLRAGESGVVNL